MIKSKIAAGEKINGVCVNEAGEVVMDEAFTTGLLAKTGLATFTPIREDEDSGVSDGLYRSERKGEYMKQSAENMIINILIYNRHDDKMSVTV